jgi:hypothetical protein
MESFFNRLYKKRDIQEDFITEGLSGVLMSLPVKIFIELFFKLELGRLPFKNPSFETQKYISSTDRNDLVITDDDIIVIFENKWDVENPIPVKKGGRQDAQLRIPMPEM